MLVGILDGFGGVDFLRKQAVCRVKWIKELEYVTEVGRVLHDAHRYGSILRPLTRICGKALNVSFSSA